jgi:putative nucleotidyltransferase with HDIG domain
VPLAPLDVKDILREATRLPSLPTVGMQIVSAANDPTTAAEDLSKLLSVDQSLSAKVLRLVNASYYGVRNRVTSIRQAVVILGFESVRALALSAAVMDRFETTEAPEGFSRTEFWKHSLGVAMTARLLARYLKRGRDEEEVCYMAGLLHDVGKVILDQYFPESFREIIRRVRETGGSFRAAEAEVNAVTHEEIGAFLSVQWGLPEPIVEAIRFHHRPMETAKHTTVVDSVHFANILVKTRSFGSGGDDDLSNLSELSVQRLGLSEADAAVIVEVEMEREFELAKEMVALLG